MQKLRRITVSFLTLIMILSVAFVPIRTKAEGTVRIDFSNRHPSAGSTVNIRVWDLNGATQTVTVSYDPGLLTITGASTSYSGGNGSVTLTGSNVYLYMKTNAAGTSPVRVYINGTQAQSAPLRIGKSAEELQQEKAAQEQAAAQKKAEEEAAAKKAAEEAAAKQAEEAAAAQQAAEAAAKRIGDDNYYVEVAAPQSVPIDSMKSVKLIIGDRQFDAYQIDDDSSNDTSIYYVYGTDKNGTAGWFTYNAADQKIEAADMDALAKTIKEKEEKEAAEKKAEEQKAAEKEQASETEPNEKKAEDKGFLSKLSDKKVLIIAVIAVIVILLIIILAVKAGKKKSSSESKESRSNKKKNKRRKTIPAEKDDNGYAPLNEEPADYDKEYKNSVYRSLLENEEGGSANSYNGDGEILPTVESVQAEREARATEYMSDASDSAPETAAVESSSAGTAMGTLDSAPETAAVEPEANAAEQQLNIFEPADSESQSPVTSEPFVSEEPIRAVDTAVSEEPVTESAEPAADEALSETSAASESVDTTPAVSEPVDTTPAASEPVDTTPVASEPVDTIPAASESVDTTPTASESVDTTPTASEPTKGRKPKKRRFRHRVDDFWDYTGNDDEEYVEAEKRREAERQAREEADRQAEAERQAREEAERQAREEAERQAREEADRALLDDMPPVYTDTKLPDYRPRITPEADVTEDSKPEAEENGTLAASSESVTDENKPDQQETEVKSGKIDDTNKKSSSDNWSDDDDFIDLNDF